MKRTGLKNRFPVEVRTEWTTNDWWACLICGKNNWDALHHILSSSVIKHFKKGRFNKSIFNSCPIHNDDCHLYNGAVLHTTDNVKLLLQTVKDILINKFGYKLKPIDEEFLSEYKELYSG